MTKIMLVEDDNNLREIYEARLKAEGFEIVSAADGEAALALAANEHPDLVITDVMMPKISGFEMLDILRNTEGLRNVKVIMLTALGQAEDNARAGALGADRYLVKSQVTLEDIIKAAHDVLAGEAAASTQAVAAATGAVPTSEPVTPTAAATPVAAPAPAVVDMPVAAHVEPTPVEMPVASAPNEPSEPVEQAPAAAAPEPAPEPAAAPEPVAEPEQSPVETPAPNLTLPPVEDPVQQPVPDPINGPGGFPPAATTPAEASPVVAEAPTAAAEENTMRSQIDTFLHGTEQISDPEAPAPAQPAPAPAQDDNTQDATDDNAASQDQATTSDDNAQPSDDTQQANTDAPATGEEDPTEIAEDDAAPDLGQFAIHPEEKPAQAGGEEPSGPPPTPDQAEDDKVVSSAINDMLATTGTGEVSGAEDAPAIKKTNSAIAPNNAEYSDGLPSEYKPAGGAPTPNNPTSPTLSSVHGGTSSMKSRVLQPLEPAPRPDINQLLNVEDAKHGAQSAASAAAVQQTPEGPVVSSDEPEDYQPPNQRPASPQGHEGVDPNSIAL